MSYSNSVTTDFFRDAFAADNAATSFTNKIPTATKPTGAGVVDLYDASDPRCVRPYIAKFIQLVPYGTTTDNTTFDLRLWAWNKAHFSTPIWVPQLLLDLTCTLGNIDGTALATSGLMVDTIVINEGDTNAALISTADDTIASILVHLRGAEVLEFSLDLTGAVSANCLYRLLDQS